MLKKLHATARRQHGLLTIAQIRRTGITDRKVETLVRRGDLRRVRRGVYALPGSSDSSQQRALAVCLASPSAVVSHITAAALWGLLDGAHEGVDITVPRNRRPPPDVCPHRADLTVRDVTRLGPVPITTVRRTLIDIRTDPRLEMALDEALRRRLVRIEQLVDTPGRLGRLARERVGGAPESELERKAVALIKRFRLPKPVLQFETLGYRIDIAYPDAKLAIELDGFVAHFGKDRRQADLARQNALEVAGWRVLRFTWDDITLRPTQVAAQIRAALKQARSSAR